ncbi:MAG: hypothetical protein K2G41_03440 [Duncaniella sp.]|uniref:hypothetical protein n=1 Tax=Duncaniella sp. TaxID=2518496 RepID=UPI0019BA781E|nr:hypothetical protein [Duncaniella sp.]MBD5314302.1 hypothetical protein [Bacteroides sp.]MDE6089734.1 hypothetical protein [Duncaniella sp.]
MSNPKELPHEKPAWTGYTLDELRYLRAYTAARIEINRDRIERNVAGLKDNGPVSKGGLLGKVLGTLSYIDIALLTYKVGSKAFKTIRLLRGKR